MLLLQKVVDLPLLLDPIHCLLGLPFSGVAKPIKRLISDILLAAKRVIPLYWLSNIPALWSRFLQLIADIQRMKYLLPLYMMLFRNLIKYGNAGISQSLGPLCQAL